jgi:hypothetical protein
MGDLISIFTLIVISIWRENDMSSLISIATAILRGALAFALFTIAVYATVIVIGLIKFEPKPHQAATAVLIRMCRPTLTTALFMAVICATAIVIGLIKFEPKPHPAAVQQTTPGIVQPGRHFRT